jgi:hypothetical protein
MGRQLALEATSRQAHVGLNAAVMPVVAPRSELLTPRWSTARVGVACAHCGDSCDSGRVTTEAGDFCCSGCEAVYALLRTNGLAAFYSCDLPVGVSQRGTAGWEPGRFNVLDDPSVRQRFVVSDDGQQALAKFSVPGLHCASCVWLIERLGRVDNRIGRTEVDLLRRTGIFRRHVEIFLAWQPRSCPNGPTG